MVDSSQIKPVNIGLSLFETNTSIEPIGGIAAGPRREINRACPCPASSFYGNLIEHTPNPFPPGPAIDHDVLDPGPRAGRDREYDQRQTAIDVVVLLRDEQ